MAGQGTPQATLSPNSMTQIPRGIQQQNMSDSTSQTQRAADILEDNNKRKFLKAANVDIVQSYYADKDLAWWLQLARDFKSARQVPLPTEDEDDL